MLPKKVKKILNTSLSPPLDLLSWRTMAITNAFSCSSRNTHSAKGSSQLSAGCCRAGSHSRTALMLLPPEVWDQLAKPTGRGNHFIPLQ